MASKKEMKEVYDLVKAKSDAENRMFEREGDLYDLRHEIEMLESHIESLEEQIDNKLV